jgi:hypothetical protein
MALELADKVESDGITSNQTPPNGESRHISHFIMHTSSAEVMLLNRFTTEM